jgi:hypothetical protein
MHRKRPGGGLRFEIGPSALVETILKYPVIFAGFAI